MFLLKAGGQRVIECVVEGPPRVMARAEPTRSLSQSEDGPLDVKESLDKPLSAVEFQLVKGELQFSMLHYSLYSMINTYMLIQRRISHISSL